MNVQVTNDNLGRNQLDRTQNISCPQRKENVHRDKPKVPQGLKRFGLTHCKCTLRWTNRVCRGAGRRSNQHHLMLPDITISLCLGKA